MSQLHTEAGDRTHGIEVTDDWGVFLGWKISFFLLEGETKKVGAMDVNHDVNS